MCANLCASNEDGMGMRPRPFLRVCTVTYHHCVVTGSVGVTQKSAIVWSNRVSCGWKISKEIIHHLSTLDPEGMGRLSIKRRS